MTLATGATSDGNGGWASVRFNGKSNQQNYLNFDGVDGTYVWDASPGYLNATGSQFRLQTSMESVAEFRVNSGLAPAESGLGSGGNITVVTKSGSEPITAARSSSTSATTRSTRRASTTTRSRSCRSISSADRSAARSPRTARSSSCSFEGLRQTHRPELHRSGAERRSPPADPRRRAGRQRGRPERRADARGRAASRPASREGTVATSNPLLALTTLRHAGRTEREHGLVRARPSLQQLAVVLRAVSRSATANSIRPIAPSRRAACCAKQRPQNVVANLPEHRRQQLVNEVKVGYNGPQTSAIAFGAVPGYDPVGVSLSGTVTSSSIDARGTTGIARSGLLIRATSASSTTGSIFDPRSLSFNDAVTWTRGAHTMKGGLRVPQHPVGVPVPRQHRDHLQQRQRLHRQPAGGRPVALDSPVFTPQQFYLIGFAQDSWRATDRLTLELGLRYDFYSVVKEKRRTGEAVLRRGQRVQQRPGQLLQPGQEQLLAAPLGGLRARRQDRAARRVRALLRPRPVRGSHPADRELHRAPPRAAPPTSRTTAWRIRCRRQIYRNSSVDSRLHARASGRVQRPVRRQRVARAARRDQPDGRLHRQPGQGHVPARRREHARLQHACASGAGGRPGRLQDVRLPRRSRHQRQAIKGCGYASYDALQLSATRRFRSGFTGGLQYQYSRNKGTTQGSNEAATTQNTFDYETEYGTNPQDIPHTFNGSLVYQIPGEGFWTGGWRVGGIVNARSGVPINVTIAGPDNLTVNGATVTNIPGGNSRGTQRPDVVPGVDPYLKDGVRWLNPAAFATPQPGTFGNLPRNALRGPEFWQADLMFSKDFRFLDTQGLQVRVEMFNIANRLNYENPAATLPNGTAGRAVHRRAGRHVRLHARTAQPHGRSRHGAADADLDSVFVLNDGLLSAIGDLPRGLKPPHYG